MCATDGLDLNDRFDDEFDNVDADQTGAGVVPTKTDETTSTNLRRTGGNVQSSIIQDSLGRKSPHMC